MALGPDDTTAICEKAVLDIGSEPAAASPEMYRVCGERNDDSAFSRFLGADSGNRLAASRMEPQGAGDALKTAIERVRTFIGKKNPLRRIEPGDLA
jgi:hypothetical protein